MEISEYAALTKKRLLKPKSKTRPLPKAREAYIEAEEAFENALNIFEIKYQKKFQIKTTKHWRFDFLLIEHKILVEISGGPWSGGRKGKLANKAWSLDRYDMADELGYTVVRIESAPKYKIQEDGPLQIEAHFSNQWLKNLKRYELNSSFDQK